MAYEKKPGDISIFKNDRKEKDTHPDYRGTGVGLNGEKIKVALWLKTDRNGNKFMAGRIEEDTYQGKSVQQQADDFRGQGSGGVAGGGGRSYDLNDEIPFVSDGFTAFGVE